MREGNKLNVGVGGHTNHDLFDSHAHLRKSGIRDKTSAELGIDSPAILPVLDRSNRSAKN